MKPLPVAIPPWCTTSLQLVLAVSALFIATNLIVDLAYRFIDPRVRVEESVQT